jgi:hypothetical protein
LGLVAPREQLLGGTPDTLGCLQTRLLALCGQRPLCPALQLIESFRHMRRRPAARDLPQQANTPLVLPSIKRLACLPQPHDRCLVSLPLRRHLTSRHGEAFYRTRVFGHLVDDPFELRDCRVKLPSPEGVQSALEGGPLHLRAGKDTSHALDPGRGLSVDRFEGGHADRLRQHERGLLGQGCAKTRRTRGLKFSELAEPNLHSFLELPCRLDQTSPHAIQVRPHLAECRVSSGWVFL